MNFHFICLPFCEFVLSQWIIEVVNVIGYLFDAMQRCWCCKFCQCICCNIFEIAFFPRICSKTKWIWHRSWLWLDDHLKQLFCVAWNIQLLHNMFNVNVWWWIISNKWFVNVWSSALEVHSISLQYLSNVLFHKLEHIH